MRIALITETWLPSVDGVVTRLRHTVDQLAVAGHEPLVIAPTAGTGTGARQLEVPAAAIPLIDSRRRVGLPFSRPAVTAVHAFDPDVVHIVSPAAMGWAAFRALAGTYPTVVSLHTDLEAYASRYRLGALGPLVRTMMRRTYGRADLALATSPTGQRRLATLGITAQLWPPGVDATVFGPGHRPGSAPDWLSGDPERPTAICVGRLAPEKDIDRLAGVVASASRSRHPWQLTLIGDGPDRAQLERRFAGLPVRFAGLRSTLEVAEAYAAADVLLMPSVTETVGLVLLEAAASGLPIVATDTPASRHTLRNYPATFVPPTASVDDWLAAVAATLAGGRPAPARVASWSEVTGELIAAYRSVALPRRPGRPHPAGSPAHALSAASADRTARRSFVAGS